MRYNDLFDRNALRVMAVAKRGAVSKNKPAITSFMVAKVIIINDRETSARVFNEMRMDMARFHRMADERIDEMPSVSAPTPYVDEELDGIVREAVRHDADGNAIAGSVTIESMLSGILRLHRDECNEYGHEDDNPETGHAQAQNILERYSTDWTELASRGMMSPVIGRENELMILERALLRKTKNNPVLVGDAGIGKTAIVEGFALKVSRGEVPEKLSTARILALDIISLMGGAGVAGLKEAMNIAKQSSNTILFIDEIHALPNGVADILKPFLARGELKLIGASTAEEYSRVIESDKAFARRLQRIEVSELSEAATLAVLEHIRPEYERHHGIKIDNSALKAAVELSQRYVSNRRQPDKSIDLIDEATAMVRMAKKPGPVNDDDIREVLSKKTGIPVTRLQDSEKERLLHMDNELRKRVIGQNEAIEAVCKSVRRSRSGLSSAHRPIGSFLFLGPTGVGKTELAKALAEFLFGDESMMTRIDMSEYQESHTVSRLIGSPPGYVGYHAGGQLTEAVSRKPYSIILLDEIEKAHPAVFQLFLQVLDDGRLTDGRGRTIDFRNTIIILTSNLGSKESLSARNSIGFGSNGDGIVKETVINAALKSYFSPEFLNRLDAIVSFNALDKGILLEIAKKMLAELREDLKTKGYNVDFEDSVADYIVSLDTDLKYGARPIRRAIEKNVTDTIVNMILSGRLAKGRRTMLTVSDGILQTL